MILTNGLPYWSEHKTENIRFTPFQTLWTLLPFGQGIYNPFCKDMTGRHITQVRKQKNANSLQFTVDILSNTRDGFVRVKCMVPIRHLPVVYDPPPRSRYVQVESPCVRQGEEALLLPGPCHLVLGLLEGIRGKRMRRTVDGIHNLQTPIGILVPQTFKYELEICWCTTN